MALHVDFPSSPYEILDPALRWFPAAEEMRETAYEKLLPPLVAKVRQLRARQRFMVVWACESVTVAERADIKS